MNELSRIARFALVAALAAACQAHAPPPVTCEAYSPSPKRDAGASATSIPSVGDGAAKIEAYLCALKDDATRLKSRLPDVKQHGSPEDLDALKVQIRDASQHHLRERERLQPDAPEYYAGYDTPPASPSSGSQAMQTVGGVMVGLSLAWLIGSATVVAGSPSVEFTSDAGQVILWPFLSSLSLGCGLIGGSF